MDSAQYISYIVPKSNSHGHSQGKKRILPYYEMVQRFAAANAATQGTTVHISASKVWKWEKDVADQLRILDEFIKHCTKDAPPNEMGASLAGDYINYQWNTYRIPKSFLAFLHENVTELENEGVHVSCGEDINWRLHVGGKEIEDFGLYPPRYRNWLHSHASVFYGRTQFIAPRVIFPVSEYGARVEELIREVESFCLFKFNRQHLRIVEARGDKARYRKIPGLS